MSNKKDEIFLTEKDIRVRGQRWISVISPVDIDKLVEEHRQEPISQSRFTARLQQLIQRRHIEQNVHLRQLSDDYQKQHTRLKKNLADYPQRLEVMRVGNERYGKTSITYPLDKKDIAYIIGYWEQNYQKVTTGKIRMTIDLLCKLCAFFQVSADVILFGFHPFEKGGVDHGELSEKDRIIGDLRDSLDLYKNRVKELEMRLNLG